MTFTAETDGELVNLDFRDTQDLFPYHWPSGEHTTTGSHYNLSSIPFPLEAVDPEAGIGVEQH